MSHVTEIFDRLRSYAGEICLSDGSDAYTYAELLERVELWRRRFTQLRIGPATVVGMQADYSLSAVAALLALCSRRAIAAFIPGDRNPDSYLIDAHAAAFLRLHADGTYGFRAVTGPSHPLVDNLRSMGDGGLIVFTSGSTGRPKAALHSVERFLGKFRAAGRQLRTLAFLRLDHIAGLDALFYTLANGGTMILARRRDVQSILGIVEAQRVEAMPVSPSFLRLLRVYERIDEYNLSTLKVITYGSEPMDASTLAHLNALFPGVQIFQKYGTTETGAPRCVSRDSNSLWMRFKRDGVETKIVDGILHIRSESAILGYLNESSPFDADGWFCTGDLVDIDGEWIRFIGRNDDLINVGGEKVSPSEVEGVILELDFVRSAMVFGQPNALLGQTVAARVALTNTASDMKFVARKIRSHCRQRLSLFKVPIEIDITLEDFTGHRQKMQRRPSSS